MTDDIVARLRVLNHHAKKLAENESLHDLYRDAFMRCENLTWEAADEIERLRRDYSCICGEMRRMMDQRDEARWRLCRVVGDNRGVWGCEIAKENGWDYLATEDKP